MCTCGTGNFAHMDHDEPPPPSAPSTPKGSPKALSKKKHNHNKNPYAARGLDKFSMVLAELETRREEIIARTGAQGVEMIRFVCDNSQHWVPIIVRPREGKAAAGAEADQAKKLLLLPRPQPPLPLPLQQTKQQEVERRKIRDERIKKRRVGLGLGLRLRWRDAYYWPVVMVLILVCLVMFGRVFAICCTSIWWYAMPTTMKERSVVKKKEIGRKLSDKRLGANLAVQTHGKKNLQELASPKSHGNGKKG